MGELNVQVRVRINVRINMAKSFRFRSSSLGSRSGYGDG